MVAADPPGLGFGQVEQPARELAPDRDAGSARHSGRTSLSLTVAIGVSFPIFDWPPSLAKELGEPVVQVEQGVSRRPKPMQPVPLHADPLGLRSVGQVQRKAHQPQVMIEDGSQLAGQPRRKLQHPLLLTQPPVPLAHLAALRS
jgi:hypothetical protein